MSSPAICVHFHVLGPIYMFLEMVTIISFFALCRTVFIGSQAYLVENSTLRVLQSSWHPCSVTHLGVLSSDSVFRFSSFSGCIFINSIEILAYK